MDKFESLRAFTQVVISGGFAAAAREMGTSRSAVNKSVIALENQLGTQLLHRSTRVVTPTEAGRAFHERCLDILANLSEAERSIRQLHEEPQGQLRMNAPMTFGTMQLAPALGDFLGQYPDLQVQLTLNDRFIDPIDEGFDITIRISQPPTSASLVAHFLTTFELILCAAPSYLAQYGSPDRPDQLRQHSCLHYGQISTQDQWTLRDAAGSYHIPVVGRLCSNNGEALRDAAVGGLGITLLPQFIVAAQLQTGQLQRVLPHYQAGQLSMYAIYPVNRHLSIKVQLLVNFLQSRFGHI
jgi:DNA-binding transcriptional LysR family regulator